MSCVVVCSGGMDSVTLTHLIHDEGRLARLVTFDYGQRHRREIEHAARLAAKLATPHDVVNISNLRGFLTGSALTDDVPVPEGHYAEYNMRSTVVANRNPIMFTIAFAIAAGAGADSVAAAVHAGDHFVYPDCRPEFVAAFAEMERLALDGMWRIAFETPFVEMSKAEIAVVGGRLGVAFEETWSCYEGGRRHCGRCGTCVERREALALAGLEDRTDYKDPDYWQSVTGENAPGGEAK